LKGTNRIEGSV